MSILQDLSERLSAKLLTADYGSNDNNNNDFELSVKRLLSMLSDTIEEVKEDWNQLNDPRNHGPDYELP